MEDRHTFSEARPAYGYEKPSWNVDVFRKGVDDPVFTLLVNSDTLPPRMRKKKIVWRLPDSNDAIPNFGSHEKERLVDLFKQQKKNRRKSSKRGGSLPEAQQVIAELNPADDCPEDTQGIDGNDGKGVKKEKKMVDTRKGGKEIALPKKNPKGGDESPGSKETKTMGDREDALVPPPPPGMGLVPLPPAGMVGNPSTPHGSQTPSTVSSREESQSPPTCPLPPPGFSLSPLNIGNDIPNDPNHRYLNAPITSTNIPVDLAQTFMDIYYCSMTHGQQEELLLHYAPGAVKSLNLGGAHSFCKLRTEMLVQLNSLQDSLWDIGGVVAQEGFQDSIVLLVTGSSLPKTAPQPIPFCHSVTLVKSPMGYQIRNDAMSLMTP